MDYSAAIESESGHSPWGSASPRAQRTAFAGAVPDSPTTPSRHATSDSQSSLPDPAASVVPAPTDSSPEQHPTETLSEPSSPEPTFQQPSAVQPQPQPAVQQQQPQPTQTLQQRPGAARYHSARQQRQVPQYKLQAKVTALERTGRKDPVLRFDVYVCFKPW